MLIHDCSRLRNWSLGKATGEIKEMCSRHVLAFGKEVQQRLSQLVIGVVSVGGLGSVIIELVMRLFPDTLVYIDRDIVELSNLNRLPGATATDAENRTRKVDVVTGQIKEFNPSQSITAVHGDFLELENQERFKGCDIIFGGSDSIAVRLATNRLALAHGTPYLDCGVGANVTDGRLDAAGGQVIKILPDSGFCLHCADFFQSQTDLTELLTDQEQQRQLDQGYIRGATVDAPQVYSLNMMVASQAVWMLLRMVSGEELTFDGVAIDALNFRTSAWKEPREHDNQCLTCGPNGIVFKGDEVDLIRREVDQLIELPKATDFSDTMTLPPAGTRTDSNTVDGKKQAHDPERSPALATSVIVDPVTVLMDYMGAMGYVDPFRIILK